MIYDFAQLQAAFEPLSKESILGMIEEIRAHRRVFVYGAGRSGLMLKAFAMRLAQMGKTVYAVGEVVTPAIEAGDLLLLASASGTTASVCRNAQTAKDVHAHVCAVTASPNAPLSVLSDRCICLLAPNKDQPAQSSVMGTLFEQALLLFCDLVVSEMQEDVSQMRTRHANLE